MKAVTKKPIVIKIQTHTEKEVISDLRLILTSGACIELLSIE